MALTAIDRNGRVQSIIADKDTQALNTLGCEHEKIHEGKAFSHYFTTSGAAGASGFWLFRTGTTCECHLRSIGIAGGGITKVTLYEGASAASMSGSSLSSSGVTSSAVMGVNRKRSSTNASDIRVYGASGAASTSATVLDYHVIGASGGGAKSGGTTAADEEFELKEGWNYAIHYVCVTGDNNVNVRMFWYET